ncbi:MAG: hypothetical protein AB1331_03050 [Bacillota bacterium]
MPYVSELKIRDNCLVSRQRVLPLPGKLKVAVGDRVEPGQELGRTELLPGEPHVLDVAKLFKIKPSQIHAYLRVAVGDQVARDEAVAVFKRSVVDGGDIVVRSPANGLVEHISEAYGQVLIREEAEAVDRLVRVNISGKLGVLPMFVGLYLRFEVGDQVKQGWPLVEVEGRPEATIVSPATGRIIEIDRHEGVIIIEKAYQPAIITSPIPGRVSHTEPGRSVTVETSAALIQGIYGIGGEGWGPLRVAVGFPEEELTPEHLSPDDRNKIIVGGSHVGWTALQLAQEYGVRGLVVGAARSSELARLAGKPVGVGVTGNEEIEITIILTEGFGRMAMADQTFNLLARYDGAMACVNGSTQIRAGVLRPEVVIPVAQAETGQEREEALEGRILEIGSRVRIFRAPYFGLWGEVIDIPAQPVAVESGARVAVLRVRLDDGRTVEVAEANVELFEAR